MEKSNFTLPTPQMLIKKAKEETIPVSLRVKESTVAIFDKMAKEAGVSRGVMMNTWLDFYAQNQNSSNDNSKDIMISYLNSERFWKVIPSLDVRELIYRFDTNVIELSEYSNNVNYLFEDYKEKKDYDLMYAWLEASNDGSFNIRIAIDSEPKYEDEGPEYGVLYVTVGQWPLVVVLLTEYCKKYKRLFPSQNYIITPTLLEKISDDCNKHKNANGLLATSIKGHLLDFLENQND